MELKKVEPKKFKTRQEIDNERWESKKRDEEMRREIGIAWNGAHADAAQIMNALILAGRYPQDDLTGEKYDEFIKRRFQEWLDYFYNDRIIMKPQNK